jgi:hypothetical protein
MITITTLANKGNNPFFINDLLLPVKVDILKNKYGLISEL